MKKEKQHKWTLDVDDEKNNVENQTKERQWTPNIDTLQEQMRCNTKTDLKNKHKTAYRCRTEINQPNNKQPE